MPTDPAQLLEAEFGSFPGLIAAWGEFRGDASALFDGVINLSWRETAALVERIAARLQADGLERGQAVAILMFITKHITHVIFQMAVHNVLI